MTGSGRRGVRSGGVLAGAAGGAAGGTGAAVRPAAAGAPSQRGGVVRWELAGAGLHAALAGLAREHEATVFMVLHAGLAALLSRTGRRDRYSGGSPMAGRTDEAVDDLVGFFVNTLVLRTDLSRGSDFPELVGRVRETVLARSRAPGRAVRAAGRGAEPGPVGGPAPLFQVMIADEDVAAVDWQLPGLRVTRSRSPAGRRSST